MILDTALNEFVVFLELMLQLRKCSFIKLVFFSQLVEHLIVLSIDLFEILTDDSYLEFRWSEIR